MDAQTVNGLTYNETEELTENPEVTFVDQDGRFYEIVDFRDYGRAPGTPFSFEIKAMAD